MNSRSSVSSSTPAEMASSKRTAAMEVSAKFPVAKAGQGKKRVALRDISKQSNVLRGTPALVGAKGANVGILSTACLLFFFFHLVGEKYAIFEPNLHVSS